MPMAYAVYVLTAGARKALAVTVNGETTRPDGKAYHITLSLQRSEGSKLSPD
jgi:hypothetical protein